MTSSHHGLYVLGYTHTTMVATAGSEGVTRSKSFKSNLNTDCSLQLDCMKPELLVIAGQLNRGEYVLGPCTHRPSHHPSRFLLKPVTLTARGGLVKEGLVRGVKS